MKLTDKDIIENVRRRYHHDTASHSFLSLYVYEDQFGYTVSAVDNGFFAEDKNGEFLFPVGDDGYKRDFILNHRKKTVYYMREEDVVFTKSILPEFEAEEDNSRSEYVYSRAEQVSLEGHKFQKVRAKLSRFYRENEVKNAIITSKNISDAYKILSGWSPKAGEGDFDGAKKALDDFFPLGLSGNITYIGGAPVGYCLGGDIGGGVYMLCSAKQISDIQGLNICTKYELYKTLPNQTEYINTESDHGSAGIRMHKNDMRPVFLNKMYKGVL